MKRQFLSLLTFVFISQFALAEGATDFKLVDTFGKCDEQYYSVIKLKIKRPEAVPFTVSNRGDKVEFSTGNLQYQPASKTFRFATRQWEFVGDGSYGSSSYSVVWNQPYITGTGAVMDNLVLSDNRLISSKYGGWIDLFGWGTSGFNPNKFSNMRNDPYSTCSKPYSTSQLGVHEDYNEYGYGPSVNNAGIGGITIHPSINYDLSDTISAYYDWGRWNDIHCTWVGYDTTKAAGNTGKDTILFDNTLFNRGTWRTLTADEWNYLLFERKVENKKSASWAFVNLKAATGTEINGRPDPLGPVVDVQGLLIFPDQFELAEAKKIGFAEAETSQIKYGNETDYSDLTYASFIALEKLGVIFLPAAGMREGTYVYSIGTHGYYWSATHYDASSAAFMQFLSDRANVSMAMRYNGCSVRLVRDIDRTKEKAPSAYH